MPLPYCVYDICPFTSILHDAPRPMHAQSHAYSIALMHLNSLILFPHVCPGAPDCIVRPCTVGRITLGRVACIGQKCIGNHRYQPRRARERVLSAGEVPSVILGSPRLGGA